MGTEETKFRDITWGNAFWYKGKLYWKTRNCWKKTDNVDRVSHDPKERRQMRFHDNAIVRPATFEEVKEALKL